MDEFAASGFGFVEGLLARAHVEELLSYVEMDLKAEAGRGGVRNLLDSPRMLDLATSAAVRALVKPVLGAEAFPVRGILFDKTADANWKVPWHQDVTIAVRERVECSGYGPWSVKEGVVHVQPPASVLEGMLTVRIHLDDCDSDNGALRVLAETHVHGKLGESRISEMAREWPATTCEVKAGGALVMRPLLVHASSAAVSPRHRRVLHFDFACGGLGCGLEWAVAGAEATC